MRMHRANIAVNRSMHVLLLFVQIFEPNRSWTVGNARMFRPPLSYPTDMVANFCYVLINRSSTIVSLISIVVTTRCRNVSARALQYFNKFGTNDDGRMTRVASSAAVANLLWFRSMRPVLHILESYFVFIFVLGTCIRLLVIKDVFLGTKYRFFHPRHQQQLNYWSKLRLLYFTQQMF